MKSVPLTRAVTHTRLHSFLYGATAMSGQGTLLHEVARSHSDTPHSVGLLWTSDQPVAETSTGPYTTITRNNTKVNSHLLAIVSLVFRHTILKHIHTH